MLDDDLFTVCSRVCDGIGLVYLYYNTIKNNILLMMKLESLQRNNKAIYNILNIKLLI